jgi:hypothetical protein
MRTHRFPARGAYRRRAAHRSVDCDRAHDPGAGSARLFKPGGAGQGAVSWSLPVAIQRWHCHGPRRPKVRGQSPQAAPGLLLAGLLAVAAGLFEITLVMLDATAGEVGSAAEVAVGVTVRLLAFSGLVYLAIKLRQSRN